jgi:hypothetical protein
VPISTNEAITITHPPHRVLSSPCRLPARLHPACLDPGNRNPQPYQQLLVHDHDMTSELAGFPWRFDLPHRPPFPTHGTTSTSARSPSTPPPPAHRRIRPDRNPARFLPADLRPRILAGDTPLGTILTTSGLPFRSEPQGFFTVPAETSLPFFRNPHWKNPVWTLQSPGLRRKHHPRPHPRNPSPTSSISDH